MNLVRSAMPAAPTSRALPVLRRPAAALRRRRHHRRAQDGRRRSRRSTSCAASKANGELAIRLVLAVLVTARDRRGTGSRSPSTATSAGERWRRRREVLHRRRDRLRHRLARRPRQRGRRARAVLAGLRQVPSAPSTSSPATGFQVITHACGDRGVREALNAYRAGSPPGVRTGSSTSRRSSPTTCRASRAENVIASMQPQHMMWLRAPTARDNWSRRLGGGYRCDRAFRYGA